MSMLDDFDAHEIRWPGEGTHAIFNRLDAHRGPGCGISATTKEQNGETTRATLVCLCGAVIVEIDYPTSAEVARLREIAAPL